MTMKIKKPLMLSAGLASIFLLAGCTFGVTLDVAKLKQAVAEELAKEDIKLVDLVCPDNPSMKAGSEFDCTATDATGEKGVIHVTVDDDKGNVTWKLV